jgi:hypothetical protein
MKTTISKRTSHQTAIAVSFLPNNFSSHQSPFPPNDSEQNSHCQPCVAEAVEFIFRNQMRLSQAVKKVALKKTGNGKNPFLS